MQTFLPFADFIETAKVLDYKRLGNQRLEARQILDTLQLIKSGDIYVIKNGKKRVRGWVNHPAVRMWEGHEQSLKIYYNCILSEWERRGFKNTMPYFDPQQYADAKDNNGLVWATFINHEPFPQWLGDEKLHASHRSNLLRKNKDFYSQYGWSEPDDLPYVWPVKK